MSSPDQSLAAVGTILAHDTETHTAAAPCKVHDSLIAVFAG